MRTATACALACVALMPGVLPGQCRPAKASDAALRTKDSARVYVESPVILPTRTGLRLFGMPSLRWWKPSSFFLSDNEIARLDSATLSAQVAKLFGYAGADYEARDHSVRLLRAPDERARLGRPLVAMTDSDRVATVFFSQSDSADLGRPSGSLRLYQLKGDAWFGGEEIRIPGTVYWSRESAVVLAAGNRIIVLATLVERVTGGGIAVATHDRGRWTLHGIPVRGMPYYLTATLVARDTALVIFGATDGSARDSNGSHLFQMRVAVGSGWSSRPERIQWSALNAVVRPVLSSRRAGSVRELVLAWGIGERDATNADSLFVASSGNGGGSWRVEAASRTREPLAGLTSLILPDGEAAFVGIEGDASPGRERKARIYVQRGAETVARSLAFVPPGATDVLATLGADADLVVTWTSEASARAESRERAPYSSLSRTALRCLVDE
jgi:hypothetical protein